VNARGSCGTQRQAAATNVPGSRGFSVAWTDSSGSVWLFGGQGYDSPDDSGGTVGYLNDLWQFSPASGQWTWAGGSSVVDALGSYGTQGAAAATN